MSDQEDVYDIPGEAEAEAFDEAPPEAMDAAGDEGLKSLPVALEVTLPQVTLSVDIVRAMSRGTTVPLGLDLSEPMKIGVNGQHFGWGSFVQIGDKIGIQIEEWKPARPN